MSVCKSVVVSVPRNISGPQLIGPIYTAMDYYFVCRVIYTDSLPVNFDVTLVFDGELLPGTVVKTVSSTSSLNATFSSQDFARQFGKTVSEFYAHWTLVSWFFLLLPFYDFFVLVLITFLNFHSFLFHFKSVIADYILNIC